MLEPKLFSVLKEGYNLKLFSRDLIAGVIVAIVAIPLSLAFAIASGVSPQQGLYTAIIAGLLISVFSGSRVQIGGPTGAFIIIIYGIVQAYGYTGLATATILAGIILIILGFSRMGNVIKFIPYPVTIGFTAGIGLLIFSSQIKDFLGLSIEKIPAEFIPKFIAYANAFSSINLWAAAIGLTTIVIIILWPRINQRIPGSVIAIILTTLAVKLGNIPSETINARFGIIPNTLPLPQLPQIDLKMIPILIKPAFSIAILAGIESLLSAVVADGMTGRRHRSNMELVAQGIANIASPFFKGIPATGAIARTATNIKNGGQTPIAGIIHALTILIIMIFCGQLVGLIPLATLAGILIVVAYNMSEWHIIAKLFKGPKSDITVMAITFFLTILVDLTTAIEVGMIMAAFIFMRRMVDATEANYITKVFDDEEETQDSFAITNRTIPDGVEVFEINGPFFFGAADKFKDALSQAAKKPKILILRMRRVPIIDATGLVALEDLFQKAKKEKTTIILSGVQRKPLALMRQTGLIAQINEENICNDIDSALALAANKLSQKPSKQR